MVPSTDPRVVESLYPTLDQLVQNLLPYNKIVGTELSKIPFSGKSSRLDGVNPLEVDLLRESSLQCKIVAENLKAIGFGLNHQ